MRFEEHSLQVACVTWFRYTYPTLAELLVAIPNGSKLSGSQLERAKQWLRFRKEGAVAGAPDLVLFVASEGFHGLMMEFKSKSGRQTPHQKKFQMAAEKSGYKYVIINSFEGFVSSILNYLNH